MLSESVSIERQRWTVTIQVRIVARRTAPGGRGPTLTNNNPSGTLAASLAADSGCLQCGTMPGKARLGASTVSEILRLAGWPLQARPRALTGRPAGGRGLPEGQGLGRRWGPGPGARARLGPSPCQWRLRSGPRLRSPVSEPAQPAQPTPSPPVVTAVLAAQIAIALTISCILLSECATRLLAASSALSFDRPT